MNRIVRKAWIILWLMFGIMGVAHAGDSLQLIRNATLKIQYGGKVFVVDPMLSDKGELKSILGINNNPIVRLPMSVEDVCRGVDYVLCTHTHFDHYDDVAAVRLKKVKTFVQPGDTAFFMKKGIEFLPVDSVAEVDGISIVRTNGIHGHGTLGNMLGPVSGFVLMAPDAPTIYIVGDCILDDEVLSNISEYRPDYAIVNAGGAINPSLSVSDGAILMDENEVVKMIKMSPSSVKFISVHMEALDHCQTVRTVLRDEAEHNGISTETLLIPMNGEIIELR